MSKHHHHHHHHHHHVHDRDERYRRTFWLTILSATLNLFLATTKIVVGKFANSHALFADGLHSLSDLLTDLLVFYAAKIGHKDADDKHPYGHERFETAGTLFVSLLLVVTGFGILLDIIEHFGKIAAPDIHISALIVILISIVTNEFLFQITKYYAKQINSELLLANAWHHRSDAWSSVIVLIGIGGSYYGYPLLDVLAALFIAFLIIKMGIDLSMNSVKELVDTAVDKSVQDKIVKVIEQSNSVVALHQLRTRKMGTKILIDVHLIVPPRITVSEGHYIGDQVQQVLRQEIEHIADITVHIDPEDDELNKPSSELPARHEIEKEVHSTIHDVLDKPVLEDLRIHYLNGQLELELICTMGLHGQVDSLGTLEKLLTKKLQKKITGVSKVNLFVVNK